MEAAKRHGATLIVVGSHGRTGVKRAVLGSVAEPAMRHADRPVLVAPHKEAKGRQRPWRGDTFFPSTPQCGVKHMAFPWLIAILVVVAILFVLWLLSLINRFVRYENAIDNAWAQIDVQLQRRGELIPNLIETVKGYAKHEKAAIDSVTQARAAMMGATSREGKMKAEGVLEQALGRLFAIAEAYPDLKANTNFLSLQDELSHTENKIAFARQAYNDSVLRYNNAIETYPAKWFAGSRTEKPMLAVPEATRAVPKVQF